jgi:propionate CoA-transferase
MANNKITTLDQAIALIRDNDVVTTSGFVQSCIPEALHMGLEKRFVETGHPKNLTLIMTAGAGDSKGLGTGRLHHEGLLGRVIAGNFGRMPKVAQAAQENKILAALSRLRRRTAGPLLEGRTLYLCRSALWRRQGQ